MPRCLTCNLEVPRDSLYRHLSRDHLALVPPHSRFWPAHEFVKRELFDNYQGLPDPLKFKKDVIWQAIGEPWIRPTVNADLLNILATPRHLNTFDHVGFGARIRVSKDVMHPCVYYRKMGMGEWMAVNGSPNPFLDTFAYTNTLHYRYWMSSSQLKVREFGNANAADAGEVIVRITFNADPLDTFRDRLSAHQEPGVQANAARVAVHREGFAEIGNMNTHAHVLEVTTPPRMHHNLGFTVTQAAELNGIKLAFERI